MVYIAMRLCLFLAFLLPSSSIWAQYYSHRSISLDDLSIADPHILIKDGWNQVAIGTSAELVIYDGHACRVVWQVPQGEVLIGLHSNIDDHGYILTDRALYQNTSYTYDSLHKTATFNSSCIGHLFAGNMLIVQDEEHIISIIDLQSGNKIDLPYVGGRARGFYYGKDKLYIFADRVYSWNDSTHVYRDHSFELPLGKLHLIPAEESAYLISESGQLWLVDLVNERQNFIDRIPMSSRIIDSRLIDNSLYLLTKRHGIVIYNLLAKKISYLHGANGLCRNTNSAVCMENSRHIWTANQLEICLTKNNYPILTDGHNGIIDDRITSTVTWNNVLYFGTRGAGLYRLTGQQIKKYQSHDGFIEAEVSALLQTHDNLYIGTSGSGVLRMDDQDNFHYVDSIVFGGRFISSMCASDEGQIYVGSYDKGLWLMSQDSVDTWSANRLHASTCQSIVDLACLANGDLFIAEKNRVSYSDQKSNRISIFYSAKSNQHILDIDIWDGWIYVVLNDEIVRTPLNGLGEQTEHFSKASGLRSAVNYSISISHKGVLISDDKGSVLYPIDYFDRPMLVRQVKSWPYRINKNTLTTFNSVQVAGTDEGILEVDKKIHTLEPGRLLIDEIQVNDKVLDPSIAFLGSSDQNRWFMSFHAITPETTQPLRYSWSLRGKQNDFSGHTDQRLLYFPLLPPDDYVLSMQGMNDDVVTNEINYKFRIQQPLTSTKSFRLICIFAGLLLLGVITWMTSRISSAKSKKRNKQLQWQNEKLEWQQKALQLQMNPHFMFNALNSIQSLIGKDDKQARYYTAKLGKLMRMTLHHSRAKWIPLNDEIDLLGTYLELEKLNRPFRYSINKSTIEDHIEIPPMMVQPIVENAVKHGIHAMMEDGEIEIKFYYEGRKIKCVVLDNGPGLSNTKWDAEHISVSTRIINERMEIYSKEGAKVLPIKLIDRSTYGAQGTEVQIGLPYHIHGT